MICPAQEKDLAAVAQIYEEILDWEEEHQTPYTNWERGKYPTLDTARKVLADGQLWVDWQGEELAGSFVLNQAQAPEYDQAAWQYQARKDQVWVVHTLSVSPRWARRGIAREMIRFCEDHARTQGGVVMRLDTYQGNEPAKLLYPNLGYRTAGTVEFMPQGFSKMRIICFEKQL